MGSMKNRLLKRLPTSNVRDPTLPITPKREGSWNNKEEYKSVKTLCRNVKHHTKYESP